MFKSIIKENDDAIALMKEKRYVEAIPALRRTLFIVKDFFEEISYPEQKQRINDSKVHGILEWASFSCYKQVNDDAIFFVYGRPIILLPAFAETIQEEDYERLKYHQDEVGASIMFNLALAIHLQSIELGASGVPLLGNALGIYQNVLQVLLESSILSSVILYNIGVIQQELFNFDKAKKSFKLSHEALCSKDAIEALYDNDRNKMTLSIVTFEEPNRAAAA